MDTLPIALQNMLVFDIPILSAKYVLKAYSILWTKTYKKIFVDKAECLQNKLQYVTSYEYSSGSIFPYKTLERKNVKTVQKMIPNTKTRLFLSVLFLATAPYHQLHFYPCTNILFCSA